MGLFGRRRKNKRGRANLALQALGLGMGNFGGNSQEDYQENVMSSLDNITEQLGSIGATNPEASGVSTPGGSGGVADAISSAAVDPNEVEESMMGDSNQVTNASSALNTLKKYKGSCKMKRKNK